MLHDNAQTWDKGRETVVERILETHVVKVHSFMNCKQLALRTEMQRSAQQVH
jgi:hypothetical protein